METIDPRNKVIQIINTRGNIIAMISFDEQGRIVGGVNLEMKTHKDNIYVKMLNDMK